MANANLYAPRLGTKIQSLKSRLGIIPGSGNPVIMEADSE